MGKKIAYKAPLAVKAANDIIGRQAGQPVPAAVEIELAGLHEIFATEDALEGLSSLGRRRPVYKGAIIARPRRGAFPAGRKALQFRLNPIKQGRCGYQIRSGPDSLSQKQQFERKL